MALEQGAVCSGSAAGRGVLSFRSGRGDGTQVASAFGEGLQDLSSIGSCHLHGFGFKLRHQKCPCNSDSRPNSSGVNKMQDNDPEQGRRGE